MPNGRKIDQMAIKYTNQPSFIARPYKIYPNKLDSVNLRISLYEHTRTKGMQSKQ
jgi:hypothetical protein